MITIENTAAHAPLYIPRREPSVPRSSVFRRVLEPAEGYIDARGAGSCVPCITSLDEPAPRKSPMSG